MAAAGRLIPARRTTIFVEPSGEEPEADEDGDDDLEDEQNGAAA